MVFEITNRHDLICPNPQCQHHNPNGRNRCERCDTLLVFKGNIRPQTPPASTASAQLHRENKPPTPPRGWRRIALVTLPAIAVIGMGLGIYSRRIKAPEGVFSYSGAPFFVMLNANGLEQKIEEDYPSFKIRPVQPIAQPPGSKVGIEKLIEKQLSFATSFRAPQDQEYGRASLRNFTLAEIPVAIDGTAVFVNPELSKSIRRLRVDQLRKIFRGEIENWQQLGGPNLPIRPLASEADTLARIGVEQSARVEFLGTPTLLFRKTLRTQGAIGFESAVLAAKQKSLRAVAIARDEKSDYITPILTKGDVEKTSSVNSAALKEGTYALSHNLFVVVRDDNSPAEAAGRAYAQILLSPEGQEIVEQAGFIPLRSK